MGSVLAILSILAGCNRAPANDSTADVIAVRAADSALQQAIEARDLDRIVAFYADDALLLPTAEPLISGKAAIREEWTHLLAIPEYQSKATLSRVDVSADGTLAYTMGTYQAIMQGEDGKPVTEPGKYVSVWKKQSDGGWRIVVDTYNTDIPPPDHK